MEMEILSSDLFLPSVTYSNNININKINENKINNISIDFNDLECEWIEIKTNKIPQAKYGY